MDEQPENFKRTNKVKPSLKTKDSPRNKPEHKVTWDTEKLEELEKYKLEHPVYKKIDEPKTPYNYYEAGDDDYLIGAVNRILHDEKKYVVTEDHTIENKELTPEEQEELSNLFKLI